MKAKLWEALKYIVALPIAIYYIFRESKYYIVACGIEHTTKRRMWLRTVFTTVGSVLPLKSLEDQLRINNGFDTCVIVFFQKMPRSSAVYLDKEFDLEIEYRTNNKGE